MNKRIVAVAVVLAVVIGGAGTALALSRINSEPAMMPPSSSPSDTADAAEPMPSDDSDAPTSTGAYIEYSDSAIANAEGRILLFFHAPWCPQCRSVESDIVAQGVPDGVTIIKVDYDSSQSLRQEYGVTLQTTFVEVDSSGDELQKHVAYEDPHLDAVLAAIL